MSVTTKHPITGKDVELYNSPNTDILHELGPKAHCYFTDHEQELFEKYGDCYLAIRKNDNKVLGSYETYRDAMYETLGSYNMSEFDIYRSDGDFNKDYFWLKTYTLAWTKHEEPDQEK